MKLFLANGLVVTRDEKIDAVAPASKLRLRLLLRRRLNQLLRRRF